METLEELVVMLRKKNWNKTFRSPNDMAKWVARGIEALGIRQPGELKLFASHVGDYMFRMGEYEGWPRLRDRDRKAELLWNKLIYSGTKENVVAVARSLDNFKPREKRSWRRQEKGKLA